MPHFPPCTRAEITKRQHLSIHTSLKVDQLVFLDNALGCRVKEMGSDGPVQYVTSILIGMDDGGGRLGNDLFI